MIVKILTEHHLEFLILKECCRGSSEPTLVKMQIVQNLTPWLNYGIGNLVNPKFFQGIQLHLSRSFCWRASQYSTSSIISTIDGLMNNRKDMKQCIGQDF